MKCLCCNREITDPSAYEAGTCWHVKCIRRFFGTERLPEIDCTEEQLETLANQTVNRGLTVPGVQKKLSLHLSREKGDSRLTIVDYPTGYILKPQAQEYTALPEAEFLVMKMAEAAGIKTVPNALMRIGGTYAYITRRIDRRKNSLLAMEDFCQLSKRQTADKYRGSYESCGRIISSYSKNTGIDIAEFFYRLLFSFAVGNSDMHLKNFSLIEDSPGSRIYGLSAAYDMLPVNVVMPADQEEMALTVNGKKKNIRKKDFLELADKLTIQNRAAVYLINKTADLENAFHELINDSYLPEDMKAGMNTLIGKRMLILR
ncbi:MAG: HipA domain-containing protein [Solobacterium sp.]|nr:HipA domain-containing protein [Solobacterium sp.]